MFWAAVWSDFCCTNVSDQFAKTVETPSHQSKWNWALHLILLCWAINFNAFAGWHWVSKIDIVIEYISADVTSPSHRIAKISINGSRHFNGRWPITNSVVFIRVSFRLNNQSDWIESNPASWSILLIELIFYVAARYSSIEYNFAIASCSNKALFVSWISLWWWMSLEEVNDSS